MSTVPYIFADDTGNIPLSQLDDNFANVKLSVDYVIQNTQANITSVGTLTNLSVSGNITTGANISGNYFIGNGSQLSGITTTYNDSNVITLLSSFGSNTISTTGNITAGNISANNHTGTTVSVTGNITGGSISATGNIIIGANKIQLAKAASSAVDANLAGITLGADNDIATFLYDTFDDAWYTDNGLRSTANVSGGNIRTSGLISATSNVTGGNLLTSGSISATSNVTGGNLLTSGSISATGNIITGATTILLSSTAGNSETASLSGITVGSNANIATFLYDGVFNAWVTNNGLRTTANVNGGNLRTTGVISATGTATVGNIITAGVSSRYVDVSIPAYANITTTGTYSLSNINSINVLIANNTGYTATLNMPNDPIDGQICNFAISGNTVTLALGTGTVLPTFAGSTTAGTGYRYVYRLSNTSWYRIG